MGPIKSKTQKKREADDLQKLGVKLIDLSPEKLERLPLPEKLRQAIFTAKLIKSHGAMRRQAQLIGKLMRAANHEEIQGAYEHICATEKTKTAEFHQMEQWRKRLINEGSEALTEFIDLYKPDDIQALRQLIQRAVKDLKEGKNTGASKALFRYLRDLIQ